MNTKRLYKKLVTLAFGLFIFSSCSKWLDVNYDSLLLTDDNATPDLVVPEIMLNFTGGTTINTELSGYLAQWMGYWCTPYQVGTTGQTYRISTSLWRNGFTVGPKLAEENAKRNGMDFYQGMMKVVQAVMWSRMVDITGDIPYFESFNAEISQPRYDSGQLIYEDIIKQLDEAQRLIKNADLDKNIKISAADIMFHGNKEKWARFINTLKLRLLIHQSNVSGRENYIRTEIQKIVQEGSGFLKSGEDAAINPGYNVNQRNAMYRNFSRYTNKPIGYYQTYANVVMMEILKRNKDPRLGFFYTSASRRLPNDGAEPFPQDGSEGFRGNRLGLALNRQQYPYQDGEYVSLVGQVKSDSPVTATSSGIIKGYDMDTWIMTSTESLFLQAEAIFRGWLPGNAEQAYKLAVKESFRWLNVGLNSFEPELSFNAFDSWYSTQGTNPEVSWQAASDKLKLILFQKYISFNGIDFIEAWCDYRRNNRYPDIPLSVDPARVSDKLPIRMLYPEDEYINNRENVMKMGTIDVFNTKVWWMP